MVKKPNTVVIDGDLLEKIDKLIELDKKIDIYNNYGDVSIIEEENKRARRERSRNKYSQRYWVNKILREHIDKVILEKQLKWDDIKGSGRKSEIYRLKKLMEGL